MKKAVEVKKNGVSLRASKNSNVLRTLKRRMQNVPKKEKWGRLSFYIYIKREKKCLGTWIINIARDGFRLINKDMLSTVHRIIQNLRVQIISKMNAPVFDGFSAY